MRACLQVFLDCLFDILGEIPVQIIRDFLDQLFAAYQIHPHLKVLLSFSRRRMRVRKSRAFTAPTVRLRSSAVSSVESSSTSRNKNTLRNVGGSASATFRRISCISA